VTAAIKGDITVEHHLDGCPACGAPAGNPFARASGIQLARCPDCTLVYSNPQPRTEVRARYLEDYDLASHFDQLRQRKRSLFERRLRHLERGVDLPGRLCDVGCADGQFLELALSAGWDCSGIELNPPAAARARRTGAKVYEGALEELEDLPWGQFDVVTCWDVLEHTPAPRAFARKLARLVVPGGHLFLTTLNWDSLVRRVRGTRWSMIADEHFTYWTRAALHGLFELESMEVRWSESFGLGRDLVAALDVLASRGRNLLRANRSETSERSRPPGWDASRVVLLGERAANTALRISGSGVGLFAAFTAPPHRGLAGLDDAPQ
jgi:2-polyprenyl-3-methyl-5-hydroxy-6-metoxy-1,4-benzoquinol methylase